MEAPISRQSRRKGQSDTPASGARKYRFGRSSGPSRTGRTAPFTAGAVTGLPRCANGPSWLSAPTDTAASLYRRSRRRASHQFPPVPVERGLVADPVRASLVASDRGRRLRRAETAGARGAAAACGRDRAEGGAGGPPHAGVLGVRRRADRALRLLAGSAR